MPLPQITIDGWIFKNELRFTPGGKAVASLVVRCGEKKKDDGSYGDSLFVNASLWETDAEAAAEAFQEGDAVTLTGVLFQRQYEKSDGTKGSSLDVKFARVSKPVRAPRQQQGQQGYSQQPQQGYAAPQRSQQPANDPWAAPQDSSAPF